MGPGITMIDRQYLAGNLIAVTVTVMRFPSPSPSDYLGTVAIPTNPKEVKVAPFQP